MFIVRSETIRSDTIEAPASNADGAYVRVCVANAPCRLEMYCRHAEYLVMNNGFRYQQAVQDLRRRGIHVPDAVANFWPLGTDESDSIDRDA